MEIDATSAEGLRLLEILRRLVLEIDRKFRPLPSWQRIGSEFEILVSDDFGSSWVTILPFNWRTVEGACIRVQVEIDGPVLACVNAPQVVVNERALLYLLDVKRRGKVRVSIWPRPFYNPAELDDVILPLFEGYVLPMPSLYTH